LSGCTFAVQSVVDGNCFISQGSATALEFALMVVEMLCGKSTQRAYSHAMSLAVE